MRNMKKKEKKKVLRINCNSKYTYIYIYIFTHIIEIILKILILSPNDAHGWVRALSPKHTLLWSQQEEQKQDN